MANAYDLENLTKYREELAKVAAVYTALSDDFNKRSTGQASILSFDQAKQLARGDGMNAFENVSRALEYLQDSQGLRDLVSQQKAQQDEKLRLFYEKNPAIIAQVEEDNQALATLQPGHKVNIQSLRSERTYGATITTVVDNGHIISAKFDSGEDKEFKWDPRQRKWFSWPKARGELGYNITLQT